MTVFDYYNLYRKMNVNLVTGMYVFGVDIHEYRNAGAYFQHKPVTNADHDVALGMDAAWPRLQQKIIKTGRSIGSHRYSVTFSYADASFTDQSVPRFTTEIINLLELAPAYFGKGSPETIRKVLRYAAAFGLVNNTTAAMNAYCTDYIGMDCSGFVGNYLQSEGVAGFTPETGATNFAPAAFRISSLDEIRAKSVLCWKNDNHVAIVDHVVGDFCRNDGTVHAMVAESCGSQLVRGDIHTDGMNYTEYVFQSIDRHKTVKVVRGIGGSNANEVHVANVC